MSRITDDRIKRTLEQFREALIDRGLAEPTVSAYVSTAKRYLLWALSRKERNGPLDYVLYLRNPEGDERRSYTYANYVYWVLKLLYETKGFEWKYRAPKGKGALRKPMLSSEDVRRIIQYVKEEGTKAERAYFALSTVYGLRRIELSRISSSDIDGDYISVFTAKGGELRQHLLAPEIAEYVISYDFKPRSLPWLSTLFQLVAEKSGVGHKPGYGFHSIRRCLITELSKSGLQPIYVVKFLRWSTGQGFDMMMQYSQVDEEADRRVFEVHPFLPEWR